MDPGSEAAAHYAANSDCQRQGNHGHCPGRDVGLLQEPIELDRPKLLEEYGNPEDWQRVKNESKKSNGVVVARVLPESSCHSDGNTDDDRKNCCKGNQLDRGGNSAR